MFAATFCLPDDTNQLLILPVSEQAAPANESAFAQAAARVPKELKDSEDVGKLAWTVDPGAGEATVTVTCKSPIRQVNVFPAADDAVEVRTVSVKPGDRANQVQVTVRARLLAGKKFAADALPSVLGYTEKEGHRRGVKTSIPVAEMLGGAKEPEKKKEAEKKP